MPIRKQTLQHLSSPFSLSSRSSTSALLSTLSSSSRKLHTSAMASARHPPFKQVEASRPEWNANESFQYTKTKDPNWVPGNGPNSTESQGGLYKSINPDEVTDKASLYKLLISAVVPRPIGFISTLDSQGRANLAPFSFFNVCSHYPPVCMVSMTAKGPNSEKDTCANIKETKEFVAQIISSPFVEAANYTSVDAPADVSEWELSGLNQTPSEFVKPPGVLESAFRMECVLEHSYDVKTDEGLTTGTIVLGRMKRIHVREDVLDSGGQAIDMAKLNPIARLGGITYGRVSSGFELERPLWKQEQEKSEVQAILETKAKS